MPHGRVQLRGCTARRCLTEVTALGQQVDQPQDSAADPDRPEPICPPPWSCRCPQDTHLLLSGFELDEVTNETLVDRSPVRATAACPKRSSAIRQDEQVPVAVAVTSLHGPERFPAQACTPRRLAAEA
jgi:hypothetical protein